MSVKKTSKGVEYKIFEVLSEEPVPSPEEEDIPDSAQHAWLIDPINTIPATLRNYWNDFVSTVSEKFNQNQDDQEIEENIQPESSEILEIYSQTYSSVSDSQLQSAEFNLEKFLENSRITSKDFMKVKVDIDKDQAEIGNIYSEINAEYGRLAEICGGYLK